jgi:sugar phosphate isomerase/epimerase
VGIRFGISTHLYHDQRLTRAHLAAIASYGFETIELFATRSHFDYHDPAAIEELAGWLAETGLALHGIHAPITNRMAPGDKWGDVLSNAVTDNTRRLLAVSEAAASLSIVKRIPARVFVVHLGTPAAQGGENNRAAALRSIEEIGRLAESAGIQVALELIPNALSDADSLVGLIEQEMESSAGICLDFGHAFLMGDVGDIVEIAAEHVITTHVHDNHRTKDEHLVPFEGTIDWDAALMAMQKIGYDGTYMMEVANTGSAEDVLARARAARQQFERLLAF